MPLNAAQIPCDESTTPGHLPAHDFDALGVLSEGMQRMLAQSPFAVQAFAVSLDVDPPSGRLPPCVLPPLPLLPQATPVQIATSTIPILRMTRV